MDTHDWLATDPWSSPSGQCRVPQIDPALGARSAYLNRSIERRQPEPRHPVSKSALAELPVPCETCHRPGYDIVRGRHDSMQ